MLSTFGGSPPPEADRLALLFSTPHRFLENTRSRPHLGHNRRKGGYEPPPSLWVLLGLLVVLAVSVVFGLDLLLLLLLVINVGLVLLLWSFGLRLRIRVREIEIDIN